MHTPIPPITQVAQECAKYQFPGSKSRKKNPLRVSHLRGHLGREAWRDLATGRPHVIVATPVCAFQLVQEDRANVIDLSQLR